jgi:RimJ/RimL family protein N-acetyltransferase
MITEESFIDFKCPYCGEPVAFPQENAGFAQACPNCTESFIVPGDGSAVGWEIPLPITTARLVLRRLAPPDWKDLLELGSDAEFGLYTGSVPPDEEGVLRWLDSDAHVKLTTPDQALYLGVMLQEGSKLIGLLSMNFTDAARLQVTFSIGLHGKFKQQGFGLEAVVAFLTFCFEGLRLHRVSSWCDSRDTEACCLLEKAGLRREGEFVKNRFLQDEWSNTVWYALLEEEFRKTEQDPAQPAQPA